MDDQFSILQRVIPDKSKAQWVRTRHIKTEFDQEEGLTIYHMDVPLLMPGTIIFVHGVNSEGEWYEDASRQFCAGLNTRLGRSCLQPTMLDRDTQRFSKKAEDGSLAQVPIIPFYWGYRLQDGDQERYPGIYHNKDMAWGGGPFQNGTNNLLQFWQDGFKRKVLAGLLDLQRINPEIDRQLQDAPPRAYFIHAARRLANLIDTIRTDFPNEPVNVVAHSQGNMITLCAVLYMKQRAPDTLILNSAPYSFDTKITDWLAAAHGWSDVQSREARFRTFQAVALKIKGALLDYKDDEASIDQCGLDRGAPGPKLFAHHEPHHPLRHSQLGVGQVNALGQQWHECPHASRDNRGKIFVNFNPHDRVIGVAAIEGIGWRGIPERLLGENWNRLPNVYQRVFARNSGSIGNPAAGSRENYWFRYFYTQMALREDVRTDHGGRLVSSDGLPVQTENNYLRTFDGKPHYEFWYPPPNRVGGIFCIQSTPREGEKVWINAPPVPHPTYIAEDFDQGDGPFDGEATGDAEQQTDYAIYKRHYVADALTAAGPHDSTSRKETVAEVNARLAHSAKLPVAKSDHGQILRYGSGNGQARLVEQVLSYDLTIGQGYAFGDANYWQYLLDLADWKISDPYYHSGKLPAPVSYPLGLDPETVQTAP